MIPQKSFDLKNFFLNPISLKQKQYEALRSIAIDNVSIDQAANKFGYKQNTLYSLLRDAKAQRIDLFPAVQKGPAQKRTSPHIQEFIIASRKNNLSTTDIHSLLEKKDVILSARSIERILKDAGFHKLKRRTFKELGKTQKNTIIPQKAENLDFDELEPFYFDCPVAGVFFFIPYIIESSILDIVKNCHLPKSSVIGATQACLSMLLLKLIGEKRLSHIGAYDQEPGLGLFAGLNILPKATYMNTYSCRTSETELFQLQNKIVSSFKNRYPSFYKSSFINLDFHSIPHFGNESEMEKVWCGAKGKSMKGANTVFASDSESNAVLYTKADILRSEEPQEVKNFIAFWKQLNGNLNETLVFDCKFTTYPILDELEEIEKVKFITLRKRHEKLLRETAEIPDKEWQRVHIPIPKRKFQNISVYENKVLLNGCKNYFRQIIVKDHGRNNPTFIISNNFSLPLKDFLTIYAKRWHIENKLAELVSFFNLNALSSPIMTRIHFDILWTVIADTLYHIFAKDLRRFENKLAPTIFKKFIDMPGKVGYDGNKFFVKIRKRAHTPILKDVPKLIKNFTVPWLNNKKLEIIWTA